MPINFHCRKKQNTKIKRTNLTTAATTKNHFKVITKKSEYPMRKKCIHSMKQFVTESLRYIRAERHTRRRT